MVVLPKEVQLVDFDPDDAVRMGLTALPNAAADAAGGLAISDDGGLDLDSLVDMLFADKYVDTSVTPWDMVYMLKGTGGIGVGTELLRQNLKDVSGVDLTATTTVIGQAVE